jgi:release factor glutamine methyltransferase
MGAAYKPLLVKYLSRNRMYTSNGITLEIAPQVFHPGFFTSTKLLLRFVNRLQLKGKTLLELGAGSGLIAMHASREGAKATASDINPVAIEYLEKNSRRNGSAIRIIHSDLFDDIPLESFDIIAINPPYYKKDPHSPQEYAWFCGKNGEYFERLFSNLANYMHEDSNVLMVLCDGCDLDMINSMAAAKGFKLNCLHETRNLLEKNFIFNIEKI